MGKTRKNIIKNLSIWILLAALFVSAVPVSAIETEDASSVSTAADVAIETEDTTPVNAGTVAAAALDIVAAYTEINAEAALADPNSVFYYYQKLISLRHTTPIIVYGTFRPLLPDSEVLYAYEREMDGKVLTVAANWTDREQECTLFDDLEGEELISNYDSHRTGILQPYEARVILH